MGVLQDLWTCISEDFGDRIVSYCREYSFNIIVIWRYHYLGYTPPAVAGCWACCIAGPATGISFFADYTTINIELMVRFQRRCVMFDLAIVIICVYALYTIFGKKNDKGDK